MGWQSVIILNVVIAACYFAISTLILHGLLRTRQVGRNPLALATAAIFLTCGLHHGHHAAHLVLAFDGSGATALAAVREVFGEWHSVAIDLLGAAVAITYLGLRRSYKTLLNTPAMFEDAVRVAAERQLRELAFTDQLTGVPNRAAYQQYADLLAHGESTVVVLFVDLDGFKTINDTYGHDVGDRLLRDVAQRLMADLAPLARVFRIGGDEFVVIGQQEVVDAPALAARAEQSILAPLPMRLAEIVIGASIGVASGPSRSVDRLVRDADAEMYEIKGRRELAARRGRVSS